MSQGWIKLHRQIRGHWLYKEERKFSRYEAWLYLLMEANHAPAKFIYEGSFVSVERGQFITSKLKLSEKWNWDRSTVGKFLQTLIDEGMIVVKTSNRMTVISVCNYDTYQDKPPTDPATDVATVPTTVPATPPQLPPQPAHTNKNNKEDPKNDQEQPKNEEEALLPPSQFSKYQEIAEVALLPVSSDIVQRSRIHISTGRRPLTTHPDIWLTVPELCRVLELYAEWGIPIDARKLYRIAFDSAQSKQLTKRGKGKDPTYSDCFSWLISFEAQNVLETLIKQQRLKRVQ